MAMVCRSAKSSSDWSSLELIAYRITVTAQSPQEFFGQNAEPPLENILDFSLVNSAPYADDLSDDIFHYLTLLDLATNGGQDHVLNDFSRETLRILGFVERGLALSTAYDIPLGICGGGTNYGGAKPTEQSHRRTTRINCPTGQPEPQVIAGAIAAYQHNNEKREARGLPAVNAMTIPCITMNGTQPTFYLVPVTRELSVAVMTGQYPYAETKVTKCVTTFGPKGQVRESMETVEYRRLAFQRFIAFRGLAKECWKDFWQTFLV